MRTCPAWAALVGRPFAGRAGFESWHLENAGKLTWDEAAGAYRLGR